MKTHLVIQNPQAKMPLRIPLSVECNMPDDRILANVMENSKTRGHWIKSLPAHRNVAILCGGGPSLTDTLGEIKSLAGDVFALNGAAGFLHNHGILADYQIIMDAQPATADLIGPATKHLFASQVDPECFRRKPNAILWHATHGKMLVDEQEGFPRHDEEYALVGSAVSVGNTALVLLYVLGYRKIHVFGMDSSHRDGSGHAYRQSMNDDDPCTIVEFGDKKYVCSLTMSLQAKHFQRRAEELRDYGVDIQVHGSGLLPDMYNAGAMDEEQKYRTIWDQPEYRQNAPGEIIADKFLQVAKPSGLVIDFGCGTGRGALNISNAGHRVLLLDLVENSRDESTRHLPFRKQDLTKPFHVMGDSGYCTDVMEHIPPQFVGLVVQNIMRAAPTVFFQICTIPDDMGEIIGQRLHLTVQPHSWWRSLFEGMGYAITWQEMDENYSSFLVTRQTEVQVAADAA